MFIYQPHVIFQDRNLMFCSKQSSPSRSSVSPHDRPPRSRKTFKYALTVVDVASRYKEAEPLTTKEAKEVATALERIYSRGPLKWPKLLQVDPGREFMGAVNQMLSNIMLRLDAAVWIFTVIKLSLKDSTALWLNDCLEPVWVEMSLPEGQRSTTWVIRLPAVISALNKEVTSTDWSKTC